MANDERVGLEVDVNSTGAEVFDNIDTRMTTMANKVNESSKKMETGFSSLGKGINKDALLFSQYGDVLLKNEKQVTALTKTTEKGITQNKNASKSLSQQIPVLRELNPLWGAMNISWLMGASAIGVAGIGMLKVAQTVLSLQAGIVSLGTSLNEQTVGPMYSYNDMQAKITDLATKWFVSKVIYRLG
jgi:hypothetical protein